MTAYIAYRSRAPHSGRGDGGHCPHAVSLRWIAHSPVTPHHRTPALGHKIEGRLKWPVGPVATEEREEAPRTILQGAKTLSIVLTSLQALGGDRRRLARDRCYRGHILPSSHPNFLQCFGSREGELRGSVLPGADTRGTLPSGMNDVAREPVYGKSQIRPVLRAN